jgi:hypothetical protein
MSNDNIENIGRWVHEYWQGYLKYMGKNHLALFNKFHQNLQPPQKIGGGILVGKSAKNTDEDHAEILRVTKEFCETYKNPVNFPKEF